jgi:hypothetical protein
MTRKAKPAVAPDHVGKKRAALAGNGQADVFGELGGPVDLDASAARADVAHHTIHRGRAFVDLGDGTQKHLVAYALASVLHGLHLPQWQEDSTTVPRADEGQRPRFVALT